MINIKERQNGRIIMEVAGRVGKEDYVSLVPQLEHAVKTHGPIRVLVELNQFEGWTPSGLVEELRFDIRHRADIERCAVLGEKKTSEILTKVAAPFFSGEVKFFHKDEIQQARAWLDGKEASASAVSPQTHSHA
jgi:hypothetical protein